VPWITHKSYPLIAAHLSSESATETEIALRDKISCSPRYAAQLLKQRIRPGIDEVYIPVQRVVVIVSFAHLSRVAASTVMSIVNGKAYTTRYYDHYGQPLMTRDAIWLSLLLQKHIRVDDRG
jgi:hypothetical protein